MDNKEISQRLEDIESTIKANIYVNVALIIIVLLASFDKIISFFTDIFTT